MAPATVTAQTEIKVPSAQAPVPAVAPTPSLSAAPASAPAAARPHCSRAKVQRRSKVSVTDATSADGADDVYDTATDGSAISTPGVDVHVPPRSTATSACGKPWKWSSDQYLQVIS